MIAVNVRTEFDSQTVMVPVGFMKRRVIARFLSFVVTTAKRSIRKAPKIDPTTGKPAKRGRRRKGVKMIDASAPPDLPPYYHLSSGWKKLIQYAAYDDDTGGVAGIIKTDGGRTGAMPRLTEHGGDAVLRRSRGRNNRRVRYREHPVMQPALEKETPSIPRILKDSMKP